MIDALGTARVAELLLESARTAVDAARGASAAGAPAGGERAGDARVRGTNVPAALRDPRLFYSVPGAGDERTGVDGGADTNGDSDDGTDPRADRALHVRLASGAVEPVRLPEGVVRFHLARRALTPLLENEAASLFAIEGDLRLIEFHSKANALTDESMAVVAAAAADHGAGVLVHNDAQHYSAGGGPERLPRADRR